MKINSKAPEIELLDQSGKTVKLSSFIGKWVVLYFYPKDNTPGCTVEAIDFSTRKNIFDSLNATVIGVSRDTPKCHLKFIEKKDLNLILLSDRAKKAHEEYGVWMIKNFFGFGSVGTNRSTFLINPEGTIVHIWKSVKVEKHADDVIQKIKDLSRS